MRGGGGEGDEKKSIYISKAVFNGELLLMMTFILRSVFHRFSGNVSEACA
jgi:hypothetical protein